MFFGDFVGDKFEGSGNFSEQKYKYYIGEWKDNLRNGKGTLCYKDGLKYQGDFINNKFEGKGKYIYEDGNYYIGEWKNG